MKQLLLLLCILYTISLPAQKKSVAMFTSYGSTVTEDVRKAFVDALQEGVFKSGKYDVLARDGDMETVQKEFALHANASEEAIMGWAEAIKADYSCFASITKIDKNYQISCKIVEAGSSYKLVFIDSKRTQRGDDDLINTLDFIATEMFSGRSGLATVALEGIFEDSDICEISLADERKATWEEAMKVCDCKGDGWSLPTRKELKAVFKEKRIVEEKGARKFQHSDYWTSEKRNNYESYSIDFKTGDEIFYSKLEKNLFRCIKKD
jgi:hypothetical protein